MLVNDRGIVQVTSSRSFAETSTKLESVISAKGLTIFARIDFSGDAERSGLKMNPTRMVIFGSPRAGTPLMVASPSLALDLPLKVIVSQEDTGRVFLSYNSPEYLKERHNIPDDLLKNISGIKAIVESSAEE